MGGDDGAGFGVQPDAARDAASSPEYRYAAMERSPEVVTDFPYRVRVVPHAWVPMADGARLAAKLWLPEGAEDHPVPAI